MVVLQRWKCVAATFLVESNQTYHSESAVHNAENSWLCWSRDHSERVVTHPHLTMWKTADCADHVRVGQAVPKKREFYSSRPIFHFILISQKLALTPQSRTKLLFLRLTMFHLILITNTRQYMHFAPQSHTKLIVCNEESSVRMASRVRSLNSVSGVRVEISNVKLYVEYEFWREKGSQNVQNWTSTGRMWKIWIDFPLVMYLPLVTLQLVHFSRPLVITSTVEGVHRRQSVRHLSETHFPPPSNSHKSILRNYSQTISFRSEQTLVISKFS